MEKWFFSIYFTITRVKNIFLIYKDCHIEFHYIEGPPYM